MDFAVVEYLPYASGDTLGIKKSIHEKIGGFDESFILPSGCRLLLAGSIGRNGIAPGTRCSYAYEIQTEFVGNFFTVGKLGNV